MENLFRFFKFLLIPIRVPFGTVALVSAGPILGMISTTAITIGTSTFAKFGKSSQRIIDPDFQAISDMMLGTLSFLGALANPFDELGKMERGNLGGINSLLNKSDEFSTQEKEDIREFMTNNSDELDSDLRNLQETVKEHFPNGLPDGLKAATNWIRATPEQAIEQLKEAKDSKEELSDLIKEQSEIDDLKSILGEDGFKKEYEKLGFTTPFDQLENKFSNKSPSPKPEQNLTAKAPFAQIDKSPSITG